MIERITINKKLFALIVNKNFRKKKGINFFTSDDLTQQVGYMNHPKNYNIQPHLHKKRLTKILVTTEIIIILKGLIRIDFYSLKKKYLFSKKLKEGQIIFLMHGGHGFKVLKDTQMIEVKQGPFKKDSDKVKFLKVDEKKVKYK
tara:strand:+ start:472 stop:903 length:432 start_codon:yes stop_codon:yes gene_type:complete